MSAPLTSGEITLEWLNETLSCDVLAGGTITGFELTNIGEGTGIFGDIVRATLTVDGGEGPPSVVVKMACTEPQNLAVAQALGIYDREINMFANAVGASPLRAPACHFAERADDGRFTLVLEDMSVAHEIGDQIGGATLNELELVADTLADFHAHWWESPQLDAFEWLPTSDHPAYVAAVPPIVEAGLPILEAEWADKVGGAAIDLARRVAGNFEQVMITGAQGPFTLIHGDLRFDNVFFELNGDGDPVGVALIDFQLSLKARGVADLAYVMTNSAPTDVATEHWEAILRRWCDRVAEHGVTYSFDDALAHYRQSILSWLSSPMSLLGTFDSANERGAMMTELWTTRAFAHAIATDSALEAP